MLQLAAGQVVVHPHHGPSTVTGFITRKIKGTPTRYARLEVHHSDLLVGVPLDRSDELGIREPMSRKDLRSLLDILTASSAPLEKQWARRIKAYWAQVLTGDLEAIAEVVRDVTRRQHAEGVSMGERNLLRDARTPLVNEIAVCLSLTPDEAEQVLDRAILDHIVPAA